MCIQLKVAAETLTNYTKYACACVTYYTYYCVFTCACIFHEEWCCHSNGLFTPVIYMFYWLWWCSLPLLSGDWERTDESGESLEECHYPAQEASEDLAQETLTAVSNASNIHQLIAVPSAPFSRRCKRIPAQRIWSISGCSILFCFSLLAAGQAPN